MCFSSSWFVLIVFSCSSWLTSQYGQVTCLYQHSSMERRNCSEFLEEDYPQITVRRNGGGGAGGGGDFGGDQEFTGSFQIDEHMLLDHEVFYFKCVAKYPIEWISNEQSNNHAVSIAEMFCVCLIIFLGVKGDGPFVHILESPFRSFKSCNRTPAHIPYLFQLL